MEPYSQNSRVIILRVVITIIIINKQAIIIFEV